MNAGSNDEQLWADFCAAESAFFDARMALVCGAQDLPSLISGALKTPSQRGPALRLLEILPEDKIRQHLASLVDLASVGHSDVGLCRSVILRIERDWLVKNIDPHIVEILKNGGEEEFRRIAELYKLLNADLLDTHLKRCAVHVNSDVREIAADFAQDAAQGGSLSDASQQRPEDGK